VVGPQGPAGPAGANGANGTNGVDGAVGPQGPQGEKGDTGDVGPQGPEGPEGPQGAEGREGTFVSPGVTYAVFNGPTQAHYTDPFWTLESTGPANLQLRRTAPGGFLIFGITYPNVCTGNAATLGTNTPSQIHRYSVTNGDTLVSSFCGEGSFSLVTVFDQTKTTQFRCFRLAGNANVCQQVF
jgi:hypothetical protein